MSLVTGAVSPGISAPVSGKPKRGRPRRYHPDHVALIKQAFRLTPRGCQNKICMGRAQAVLEPVLPKFPELAWLLNRADGTYRVTIVSELGRVPDAAALIFLAREVARHRLKSREAVAYIRRTRFLMEQRDVASASADGLAHAVRAAVEDYRTRHPDLTRAQVRDGLTLVFLALVPEGAG